MITGPFLLFGLLLGVRHALEADHVAAVTALAARHRPASEIIWISAAWGFGHALTLISVGATMLVLGWNFSERLTAVLELCVGVMLVALGVDVLRRLRADNVHVHSHTHDDGTAHVHIHRHVDHSSPEQHPRRHEHAHFRMSRAVLVGGVHGIAGSGALLLLSAQVASSTLAAIGYLVAFGIGSVIGMALFSIAVAVPMRLSAKRLASSMHVVEACLGYATIAIGVWVAWGAAS